MGAEYDLAPVSDAQIKAEFRRRFRRSGRSKKLAPCVGCGLMLGARERRQPCPQCGARNFKAIYVPVTRPA